jgi:hypothetical protein
MHGLMDTIKNASSFTDQGTAIVNTLQQLFCSIHHSSYFAVSTAEAHTKFFRFPQRKKSRKSSSGELLGHDTGPCFPSYPLSSVGNLKVISGSVTEMGWGTIMHEPHVSSNIQWESIQ